MVQKIQNLDTEITNEQIEIEWAQIISTRNKLLEISDWTQLGDVFLTKESKRNWSIWRHKVRKINKINFSVIQEAKEELEILKNEMPRDSKFDEAAFADEVVNSSTTIVQKVIKEQPVIIREILDEPRFKETLIGVLEKDIHGFKSYLTSFMKMEDIPSIADDDNLEEAKAKIKEYVKRKQNERLEEKLASLPNQKILHQEIEEAIEFIAAKSPDLEDYPLIKLNSEMMKMTPVESAMNFLRQKKWYNTIILDSERFLLYTNVKIEEATTIVQLRSIISDIMYGY